MYAKVYQASSQLGIEASRAHLIRRLVIDCNYNYVSHAATA